MKKRFAAAAGSGSGFRRSLGALALMLTCGVFAAFSALPSPASFHWGGAAGGICAGFPEVSAFFRSFSRGLSLLLLTSVEKSFKI